MKIEINPDLNIEELSSEFTRTGILQIKNFFTNESAELLLQAVINNDVWYLAYNDGNGFYESHLKDFEALPVAQKNSFANGIYKRASNHFQYYFIQYYISQAIELGEDEGHPLHEFHQFLNSDNYLSLMREITGENRITKSDSFVSRYEKCHFLTDHNDKHEKHDRVAACTFGMTKEWNPNWGGHLVFLDDEGNITQGFKPSFNTLNVFRVPQRHSVQPVNNSASKPRYNFLSWLQR